MLQGLMRKIDKRTTLPLRVPKNGRRLHEASSNFWTFTMSNSKGRTSPFTRAQNAARMHGKSVRSTLRAAADADARARARGMSVGQLGI